jgi:hypothetical protein
VLEYAPKEIAGVVVGDVCALGTNDLLVGGVVNLIVRARRR